MAGSLAPNGVLLETYGPWIINDAGSYLNAKMSTVIQDN
jgi:hypothetical protein